MGFVYGSDWRYEKYLTFLFELDEQQNEMSECELWMKRSFILDNETAIYLLINVYTLYNGVVIYSF